MYRISMVESRGVATEFRSHSLQGTAEPCSILFNVTADVLITPRSDDPFLKSSKLMATKISCGIEFHRLIGCCVGRTFLFIRLKYAAYPAI